MLIKFWEGLGSGFAQTWKEKTLTFALLFWGSGVVLYGFKNGWNKITTNLNEIEIGQALVYIIGGLVVVSISEILIDWISRPLLRIFEGYWCHSLNWLQKRLTDRINIKYSQKIDLLNPLKIKQKNGTLTPEEKKEIINLEQWMANFPVNVYLRLPTKFGNIIRTAEEYSDNRYGLEITTVFPRFWLVLPAEIKEELFQSQKDLFDLVKAIVWLVIGCIWVIFSPWVILPIVLGLSILRFRLLNKAKTYGEILCSTFDLFRFELYKSLHWPLPEKPQGEEEFGKSLTRYLKFGLVNSKVKFSHGEKQD